MAEALVSDLLKQLASIAAREAEQGIRLVVGVVEEVGRLERYLQTIQPMLNAAEKQQVNWLDDLKDACYQIDDVLDEWNTAMIKSEIEKEEEKAASEIESEIENEEQKAASEIEKEEQTSASETENEEQNAASEIENEEQKAAPEIEKEEQKSASEIENEEQNAGSEIEKEEQKSAPEIENKEQKAASEIEKEEQKAANRPLAQLVVSPYDYFFGHIESLDPDFSKEEQKAANRPVAQRVESFRDYFPPSIESLDPDLSKEEQKAEKTPVLKDKVHEISPCLDIAHKIKELTQKIDSIFMMLPLEPKPSSSHVGDEEVELPQTTSFFDMSDICGRDKDMDNLVSNLLNEGSQEQEKRHPHVISLVGMGGIGKTTLAQRAFNDDKVMVHFERRSWVCVSEPFDEIRVAKEIIRDVEGDSPNIFDFSRLIKIIGNSIRGEKFFLVLDDVWVEDYTQWEPFRNALKHCAQGSRILVTTRKLEVAKMMESACTITLNELSDEDCWLVFSKVAFFEKDSQCQLLEDIGQELAKKCKGLPLIAKVLGSLMRFKKSREQWKNVVDSNLWEFEDTGGCQFVPLLLSYNDLPSAMKRCFSYCSIFPKDKVILVKELIQMWMAHNFLSAKGSMEMEILGQQYFENLAMHSLFQDFERDTDDNRIISCKMHDIVHDFVQLLMKNECSAILVDVKESGTASFFESVRHLSLKFVSKKEFPAFVYNVKGLRTLLTSNIRLVNISTVLTDLFQHLTCLRALNLRSSSIEKLPDEIEKLIHLRFLDLSSNYRIEELPETMCNLCNLQSLDVSECYVLEKLPQGMAKLINLRHLILNGTSFMKLFPEGIGRLKSLRTLTKFIVGGNDGSEGCKLRELKDMNHLEGALKIQGLGNVVDFHEAKNAQLEKKIHLQCLCLDFDGEGKNNRKIENGVLVIDALKPHPALQHLEIFGTIVFPKWLMSLTILKKLKLSSFGKSEPLPPLGKLPFLESLEILDADSVKKVGVEFLGIEPNIKEIRSSLILFPKLNSLTFCGLKELENWVGHEGKIKKMVSVSIMPCLQVLTILDCPKLKALLYKQKLEAWKIGEEAHLSIMPCLQILTILDCPKLEALPYFVKSISLHKLRFDSSEISYWMTFSNSNWTKLKVLELKLGKYLRHLPSFGKLSVLESLSLWNADGVENVGIEFLGVESTDNKELEKTLVLFSNLRILEFWSFGNWEKWDENIEIEDWRKCVSIMPRLHSLIIYNCPKLKSLPHFLRDTPLKNLRMSGCPILKKSFQSRRGGNWNKISHVPKIKIND